MKIARFSVVSVSKKASMMRADSLASISASAVFGAAMQALISYKAIVY